MPAEKPNFQEAAQRHADHYIQKLMEEDVTTLQPDFGQIALAYRRVKAEEVAPPGSVHPGRIETRYLALAGGVVPKRLDKLVQGEVAEDDIPKIEEAIAAVENGEVEYPVNVAALKKMVSKLGGN